MAGLTASRLVLPSIGPIENFAATPKLTMVALADVWGPVSVWEVRGYGFYYRAVIDRRVCDLAWSNSGSVLAMVTMSTISVAQVCRAAVRQWPVRTVAPWDAGRQFGNALAFSPDDDVLVVGAERGWATVALDSGDVDWVSAEPTRSLRFTPGGDLLAGGEDGTLSLWRPGPWRKQASVELYPDAVGSITVRDDGTLAATGQGVHDDTGEIGVRVVQLPALTLLDRIVDDVDSVTFRPRRDQLTVGYGRHGTVELYNLTRRDDDGLVLHNRDDRVNHLAYNRPGSRLVAASFQSGEVHQVEVLARRGSRLNSLSGCYGCTGRFALDVAGGRLVMEEFARNDEDWGGHLRLANLETFTPEASVFGVDNPTDYFVIQDLGFAGDQPWVRDTDGTVYHFGRPGGLSRRYQAVELERDTTWAGSGQDEMLVGGAGGRVTAYAVTRGEGGQRATGEVRRVRLLDSHGAGWVGLCRLGTDLVGLDAGGDAWLVRDGITQPLPRPAATITTILAVSTDVVACQDADRLLLWSPHTGDLVPLGPVVAAAAFAPATNPQPPELAVARDKTLTVYAAGVPVAGVTFHASVGTIAWTEDGLLIGITNNGIQRWPRGDLTPA